MHLMMADASSGTSAPIARLAKIAAEASLGERREVGHGERKTSLAREQVFEEPGRRKNVVAKGDAHPRSSGSDSGDLHVPGLVGIIGDSIRRNVHEIHARSEF